MDAEHSDNSFTVRQFSQVWLVTAIGYFVAAAATIHLASNGRDIATFWPANALLVALLLAGGRPRWRTVLSAGFVANVVANLVTRGTLIGPMLYGIANLAEVTVAVLLLRRAVGENIILASTSTVMRFIVVAGLIAPSASGILGALTAYLVYSEPFARSLQTWVASDGLGLLIFTPFFAAMVRGDFAVCYGRKTWLERAESLGMLALVGATAYFVFFCASRPLLFAIFPPLLLITFRNGRLGAKAGVMLVAIIGGLATMHGYGPVLQLAPDPATRAFFFQVFLAVTLLTCLPAAAEVTARSRRTEALVVHDRDMTRAALEDELTGAWNRNGFGVEVCNWIHSAPTALYSLLAIDFDHFKRINDQWGHQAGDAALKHVASVVTSCIRTQDRLGRIGGDEFLILLPNSNADRATLIAERIRSAVHETPFVVDEISVVLISLSIGVASSQSGESYKDVSRRADQALYEAKRGGRDTFRQAS